MSGGVSRAEGAFSDVKKAFSGVKGRVSESGFRRQKTQYSHNIFHLAQHSHGRKNTVNTRKRDFKRGKLQHNRKMYSIANKMNAFYLKKGRGERFFFGFFGIFFGKCD
ncbi:MAG: hypothetical protein LBC13_03345 [Clostridiales bacterium]|nr:hypothetical protein [Clostridiales bacterium]